MDKKEHWVSCIDNKRTVNLLLILEELTRLLDKSKNPFVIIGAMSLLLQGYIRGYRVLWDIDLLFKNIDAIMDLTMTEKSKRLRIVEMDSSIVQNKTIGSLHTVWSFDKTWFNVDYIVKTGLFDFYNPLKRGNQAYHIETVRFQNKDYYIKLLLADVSDIFVEKMTFPRMQKQLQQKDDFGIDIRHCLYILSTLGKKNRFWKRVRESSLEINLTAALKRNLLHLVRIKNELGYEETKLPQNIITRINKL